MADRPVRHQALVYLITYSRADTSKVPNRDFFSTIVCDAFKEATESMVVQWVVCEEEHVIEGRNPKHYHVALRLNKRSRWSRVRQYIAAACDIQVNFSCNHNTYYTAYTYVTKTDKHFITSLNHPVLTDPPATEQAIESRRKKAKNKSTSKKRGRKRYTSYDVVQIVQKHKLYSRVELLNFAITQQKEGKTELMEFIANRGTKVVEEAINLGQELEEAPNMVERMKKTRLELLQEAYNSGCVDGCQGNWIANTGKSFMVAPLKVLYKAFCNPATGTFAWVGVNEAEIILLNDFKWHPSLIAWGDLLQLLEGDTIHIPTPKTHYQKDIQLSKDLPVFATADSPIVLIQGGNIDNVNTQMMAVRWRLFKSQCQ
ncbi:hypothetical protein AC249_AIPGENE24816 [Exaiptasia diaphana]|nr:hypothetical protein AC249_AIPGENE24816 [Exaiptasia diaphana]